ncbi:MAG: hypothetical protein ABJF10_12080 [Chthoniobacter sp.]|uniref:hypothetical protein n=1 Tax=Chthoniobacter sp. TaxID=2510640 RepID=UPI0032AD93CE
MNRTSFFQAWSFRRLLPLALAVCVSGCASEPKSARQERLTLAAKEYAAREKKKEEEDMKDPKDAMDYPGYAPDPDPIVDLGPPWGKWRTSALKKKMREIEAAKKQEAQ